MAAFQDACDCDKWPAESGALARKYSDELPIKVCKFDIRIMESGVLDRSCTGATPRPCGTLSDTHHRLHTLTKTTASSAEVMKENVPLELRTTAWQRRKPKYFYSKPDRRNGWRNG